MPRSIDSLPENEKIMRKKCKARDWRKYSAINIQTEILHNSNELQPREDWTSDALNEAITEAINISFNNLWPLRVIRISRNSDIVSNNIEKLKKKRKRKMKEYNKSPNEELFTTIKNIDKKIKHIR